MNAQKRADLKRIADTMYQSWEDLVDLDDESLAGLSDDARKQLLEAVDKLDSAVDKLDSARSMIDELAEGDN